jgi:hypothetical protein
VGITGRPHQDGPPTDGCRRYALVEPPIDEFAEPVPGSTPDLEDFLGMQGGNAASRQYGQQPPFSLLQEASIRHPGESEGRHQPALLSSEFLLTPDLPSLIIPDRSVSVIGSCGFCPCNRRGTRRCRSGTRVSTRHWNVPPSPYSRPAAGLSCGPTADRGPSVVGGRDVPPWHASLLMIISHPPLGYFLRRAGSRQYTRIAA